MTAHTATKPERVSQFERRKLNNRQARQVTRVRKATPVKKRDRSDRVRDYHHSQWEYKLFTCRLCPRTWSETIYWPRTHFYQVCARCAAQKWAVDGCVVVH